MTFFTTVILREFFKGRNLWIETTTAEIEKIVLKRMNLFIKTAPAKMHFLTFNPYQVFVPNNQIQYWTVELKYTLTEALNRTFIGEA